GARDRRSGGGGFGRSAGGPGRRGRRDAARPGRRHPGVGGGAAGPSARLPARVPGGPPGQPDGRGQLPVATGSALRVVSGKPVIHRSGWAAAGARRAMVSAAFNHGPAARGTWRWTFAAIAARPNTSSTTTVSRTPEVRFSVRHVGTS